MIFYFAFNLAPNLYLFQLKDNKGIRSSSGVVTFSLNMPSFSVAHDSFRRRAPPGKLPPLVPTFASSKTFPVIHWGPYHTVTRSRSLSSYLSFSAAFLIRHASSNRSNLSQKHDSWSLKRNQPTIGIRAILLPFLKYWPQLLIQLQGWCENMNFKRTLLTQFDVPNYVLTFRVEEDDSLYRKMEYWKKIGLRIKHSDQRGDW